MAFLQLGVVDWVVLAGYLIFVLVIGAIASGHIKSSESYFLGGRRFGKAVMIAQSFGTGTHAEMPVSLAGIVYTAGLSGIWFQWKNLFVTPFYWLLAPLFRRFRRTTMAEVVEDRYGPWMGTIYTLFALAFFAINLASMLKGAAKVIDVSMGGNLPVNGLVIGMTAVFVVYSFCGGLVATAWTDLLQGLLIITLSFLVIPLGWGLVGGLGGMKGTLGAAKLTLTAPSGIGPWFIFVLTLNGLVGIAAQPHLIAAVGTGKDEQACRVGQLYGNLVKRVCTVGWAIVGLMTAALIARGTFGVTSLADPEEAFGFACRHLLFPGGVGLLIASFLAANMAGCSAFMVNSGALVVNGIYRKHFVRDAADKHYLLAGRIAGVLVVVAAVVYAVFFIERILYSFLLTETMATFVGISVIGGIVWRRANRWGALASLFVALGANFGAYLWRHQRLDRWDPAIFLTALGAGTATLIVVSLLTAQEPAAATDRFYHNLQTPSGGDDAAPLTPAEAAASGNQLLLVNALHPVAGTHGVGFWRAYRTDLRGLAIGATLVAALVAVSWLLLQFV